MASVTAVPVPSGSPPPYDELHERTKPVGADDVDDRLPSDVEDNDEDEEDERLLNRHSDEVQMRARMRLVQSQAELQNFRDRFEMNRPSVWKRVALIVFLLFVLWVGFRLRLSGVEETVIHSERYSGKYKYRPAASPVITTHMPDGKLKVRGDEVGAALQQKRREQRMMPTDAVQVKGGKKKGKGKRAKKPQETTPPRRMSRET